jgi:hypothetical protein
MTAKLFPRREEIRPRFYVGSLKTTQIYSHLSKARLAVVAEKVQIGE